MGVLNYWRWRYVDPQTGHVERTAVQLTSEEARLLFPYAERIAGSQTLREVDGATFSDTAPSAFEVRAT